MTRFSPKIGIVTAELRRGSGGLGQWCCQFVTALAAGGYEVHVVAQRLDDEVPNGQVFRHLVPTKSCAPFADVAAQKLRNLKVDFVHDMGAGSMCDVFQPHGGSHAAWQTRRLDMYAPWFRTIKRPIDALLPRHRIYDRHSRKTYAELRAKNTTFVALSQMVADDFIGFHEIRPEQIALVYNGVDCQRFSPAHRISYRETVRRRLGIGDETMVLLLAAHNFRLKGVPELLRVASQLSAGGRPLHVLIAGGKHLEKWRRSASRHGLEAVSKPAASGRVQAKGCATFLGSVPDLVPYYAAADAYIHPTYYDPCSLVLLEAAASGLPIVTTRRFNGAAELFREGEEILTVADPHDADALYEQVESLFDQRRRENLGCAARNVALRHPFERNVADILRLYETRISHRRAA